MREGSSKWTRRIAWIFLLLAFLAAAAIMVGCPDYDRPIPFEDR